MSGRGRRAIALIRVCLIVAACGAAGLGAAWGAGFAWFVHAATRTLSPPAEADGIVAFTGGAERIETALRLLADGRARRLLVSGVGGTADFLNFAHRAHVDAALSERVTLGRTAASTRGNAAETAEWARGSEIHSLIVVTAGYHMPRALAELSRTLPDVKLYPVPVLSPALRGERDAATLRLLAGEYTKWLAAEAGLSGLPGWTEDRIEPCHASASHDPDGGCRERSGG